MSFEVGIPPIEDENGVFIIIKSLCDTELEFAESTVNGFSDLNLRIFMYH